MAGSSIGNIFRVTTWGESHGKAIGAVVDGCPAGLKLCEDDIQFYLDQRRPGRSDISTPRRESDKVQIMSGVFNGITTGTPISLIIWNESQRSSDYSELSHIYRPGHADYTYDMKYGIRDFRGGGRSSGRETAARVAGGAIALKILEELGITINSYTLSIGDIYADRNKFDIKEILKNPVFMPDAKAALKAAELIRKKRDEQDSVGGMIECTIDGVPAGCGDPVFEKLSANLAKAACSIGAVKGFEIGDGFDVSKASGSTNNDQFFTDMEGHIKKKTNHSGGILGGISDGSQIIFRVAIKPTPSIFKPQMTVTSEGNTKEIQIKGRHDPVIVPRAVVVVKTMAAIVIADALMTGMSSRLENLKTIYLQNKLL